MMTWSGDDFVQWSDFFVRWRCEVLGPQAATFAKASGRLALVPPSVPAFNSHVFVNVIAG